MLDFSILPWLECKHVHEMEFKIFPHKLTVTQDMLVAHQYIFIELLNVKMERSALDHDKVVMPIVRIDKVIRTEIADPR